MKLTTLSDDARLAFENLGDTAAGLINPAVRLGVTGLSRAGKTVFITALLHNLIHGGRLPAFSPITQGRLSNAYPQPQPDHAVPRFAYEHHVERLIEAQAWPTSTNRISQMRLTVDFESAHFFTRTIGGGRLHIDIVDYPGEWLLDLPLLAKDYETWSREALELAKLPVRQKMSKDWLAAVHDCQSDAPADEMQAQTLAHSFTAYLNSCRNDDTALSLLPPGRFLMPGDLAGSPAVTFTPLVKPEKTPDRGCLWTLMEERYEAYKRIVVKPFFRDHFARIDRQIVLVDALQALNAGPEAVRDLEAALAEILTCFNPGKSNWLSSILSRRIDKILFAATKADHLHQTDHDKLETLLRQILKRAIERARYAGATIDVLALASIRSTKEAVFNQNGETLNCITGIPMKGEAIDGVRFDGKTEKAIFPGSLNPDLRTFLNTDRHQEENDLSFVRFRPPVPDQTSEGIALSFPHIRLDRALEFLLGDKLA